MKTCIAILLGLSLAASGAFAQGTFSFINTASTQVRISTGATVYSNSPTAAVTLTSVEFLWAELGTPTTPYLESTLAYWLSSNPGWSPIPASIKALGPTAGRFNAGVQTANTAVPGAVIQAIVIGWYTPSGSQPSFDAALFNDPGAIAGFSSPFQIDTGNPLALPVPETPTALVGPSSSFPGLLLSIPEPGVVSITGLAAAALFVFRRRR